MCDRRCAPPLTVVAQPEFNEIASLASSSEMSTIFAQARDTLRQRVAGNGGLTLLLGQGITGHDPMKVWAAEFRSMSQSSIKHANTMDFVGLRYQL